MDYQRKTSSEQKNCINCGNSFWTGKFPHKRFCSIECQKKFYKPYAPLSKTVPPGTVGAIGELAVSIDLMKKGFEVYRALSPSSSCDVLALKGGKSYPLEIRTGYYIGGEKKEKLVYLPISIKAPYLAVLVRKKSGGEEIVYTPNFTKKV